MKRPRLVATVLACAGVFVASALAATRAYFVEPKLATSGWTPEDEYVGQSFVANVDSIYHLEWFVAEPSKPGLYRFEIRDAATSALVCRGDESVPARGWQWLRCDNFPFGSLKFTKGREYVLRVSHLGGDSVNFVYRTDNPYSYGHISVSGGELVPESRTWA